ncbi:acylneuraminate cytidylyltransferase family protein [Leptospira borgpetersenii]|uniref:acylneuraminate cytidylyltransferase family protein n=1 Tax=Leptospira borgpetersenii TaxID=174 RepID=UPI0007740224|nr:acylneuraminate cytidylyltransferase family protein [Leptospira borgpetersenii]MBE8400925.1 acylneuraminate cytidylyltransferase family protein [Leptospira borgpetersenii serovar Tarassovi]MBE8403945.1 acylneuraminate cytidylyltransferase family protein [Leptospira borgpetersenii serovar Tarassovi]MBE8406943.1 acylneuraminate cytidylyltransferase family protein [Leptospira borgpetersenii serovar Tarassovi]MBE8412659.1 acylneuraminate cytidylyltransferase family protein [Leptospira borgpeters
MKLLAVIPARGGSKRLPGKNIRILGNKPLIAWSIDVVKQIPEICDILVSTDDEEIGEIAKKFGAFVPWLRPVDLAEDTSSSIDVVLHAFDWYEKEKQEIDGVILLQPTSPFRREESIRKGIEIFLKNEKKNTVLGVSPADPHPMWCFKLENGNLKPFCGGEGLYLRSQDLPPAYFVNGSFYLTPKIHLKEKRTFYTEIVVPLITKYEVESLDIDTESDWKWAECILKETSS